MSEDERYLDILAIFHYILGGITAFFSCFPLIHVAIGLAMMFGAFESTEGPPAAIGVVFAVFGGVVALCGWALAIAMIVAGRKLKARTSRIFCVVIAAIECLMMPLGTLLGIFTLIVLMKESVVQLFAVTDTAPYSTVGME